MRCVLENIPMTCSLPFWEKICKRDRERERERGEIYKRSFGAAVGTPTQCGPSPTSRLSARHFLPWREFSASAGRDAFRVFVPFLVKRALVRTHHKTRTRGEGRGGQNAAACRVVIRVVQTRKARRILRSVDSENLASASK